MKLKEKQLQQGHFLRSSLFIITTQCFLWLWFTNRRCCCGKVVPQSLPPSKVSETLNVKCSMWVKLSRLWCFCRPERTILCLNLIAGITSIKICKHTCCRGSNSFCGLVGSVGSTHPHLGLVFETVCTFEELAFNLLLLYSGTKHCCCKQNF